MLAAGVGEFLDARLFASGDLTRITLGAMVALAVLLVFADGTWRYVRYAITTIHELGHVTVGWFAGRDVQAVRLHHDTSGLTVTRGRDGGVAYFLMYAAGYPAPPVAGFAILAAVIYERPGWAMAALLVLLLVCLVLVRNAYGVLVILVQIAAYAALWVWNEPRVLSAVLVLVGAVMSVGGLRATLDLARTQRRKRSKTSDAAILGSVTRLGATVWVAVFVVLAAALLVVTALMVWDQSAILS